MINRVVLTGRLTRNPDLRTTGSGISVATFTLAVDRQYTDAQGKRGAEFISCVIWRKAAENFCKFTSKGSLVGVDGRIQTRNYNNADGQKVYVTEVIVDNFALLESKKDRLENNDTNYTSNNGNWDPTTDPFAAAGDTIDIDANDVPF